ncbi:MAG: DUF480 domain-containing protein [Elusimicrobia bacterium]|nr:DUF480 domain-containing protein [Elusimicrobiota bacterium]
MKPELDEVQARILGCLIEKSYLTPDQYPLSFNALLNAANQKTSREPVMELDVDAVAKGLAGLKDKSLAAERFGARVPKYAHHAELLRAGETPEVLGVVCMLLLRGAQTAAELRARTERIAQFQDNAAVEAVLEKLAACEDGPFVVRQARGRWAHTLSGAVAGAAAPAPTPSSPDRFSALEERVAALEALTAELKTRLGA